MWHHRNTRKNGHLGRVVRAVLTGCALGVGAASCTPDAPDGGIPTHPTDRYSVSLTWDAPTLDAVGRPLQDLAGYRLYYSPDGQTVGVAPEMVEVGNVTMVTVDGLAAGSYVFAVTALDDDGNESDLSEPLAVEVGP